jgi:hypothetical protein
MKRYIPGLLFFLFLGGSLAAQNVVFFQGEGNLVSFPGIEGGPSWAGGSIGTNLLLYRTIVQTYLSVFFGRTTGKGVDAVGDGEEVWEPFLEDRWLLKVSDAIFASYTLFPALGLRGGVTAGLGAYSGGLINGFIHIGLLLGVHILPQSPVSFTVDLQPGYAFTFHYDTGNSDILGAFSKGADSGLVFPVSIGVRLNLEF